MTVNLVRGAFASLAILAVGASGASAQNQTPTGPPAGCVKKNNIQAIVDDSGSMSSSDPGRLRNQALQYFIDQPANQSKTLGATQFGSTAALLFAPGNVQAQGATMKNAANTLIQADDGGTNYNDAFAQAAAQNPGATARIFLTDGEPTSTFNNSHRGGPPTYVLGFGGAISPENNARLQAIASETGGIYIPQVDAANLQPTVIDLTTLLDCGQSARKVVLPFTAANQVKPLTEAINASTKSVVVNLSWPNAFDKFTLKGEVSIRSKGRTIGKGTVPVTPGTQTQPARLSNATGAAKKLKVTKLKVTQRPGATYTSLTVKNVKAGTLRFSVTGTQVTAPTNVTAQINQRTVR